MMHGLVQDGPLLVPRILGQAGGWDGERESVGRRVEGGSHRDTDAEVDRRTRRLAKALDRLGARVGDRIGTLAWNGFRHLEAYYATAGTGTVLPTVNPRLFADPIVSLVNHAEDRLLFADLATLPVLDSIAQAPCTTSGCNNG